MPGLIKRTIASQSKIDSSGRQQTLRVIYREVLGINSSDVGRHTFTVATNNTIHGNHENESEAMKHYNYLMEFYI